MTTGEKIKAKLEKRGWTATRLAEETGKSKGNVSDWLNDKHEPNLDSLRELAQLFECSVASLVGDEAS